MRIPATSQAGCIVIIAALIGFFGTKYWVDSRTLRAVDMPVSLARGTIETGPFNLNTRAFYAILIGDEEVATLACSVGLETRKLTSIGALPIYRYKWLEDESWAIGRNTIAGDFLGGFEGRPGKYDLAIEVVSDTACLNVRKPHLYILASNGDVNKWDERFVDFIYVWVLMGVLGAIFLGVGIREAVRERVDKKNDFRIFR